MRQEKVWEAAVNCWRSCGVRGHDSRSHSTGDKQKGEANHAPVAGKILRLRPKPGDGDAAGARLAVLDQHLPHGHGRTIWSCSPRPRAKIRRTPVGTTHSRPGNRPLRRPIRRMTLSYSLKERRASRTRSVKALAQFLKWNCAAAPDIRGSRILPRMHRRCTARRGNKGSRTSAVRRRRNAAPSDRGTRIPGWPASAER